MVELWGLLEEQIIDRNIDPDIKVEVLRTLTESFLNLDRWEDAIRIGRKAVEIAEAEPSVSQLNRVGSLQFLTFAMHKSDHPETAAHYERLLSSDLGPVQSTAMMNSYATWLRAQGDYKGALHYFDLAIANAQHQAHDLSTGYIYGNSALLLCDRAMYEQCVERLKRAAEIWAGAGEPPNTSLYRAMADAHLFKGDYPAALEYARVAVERGEAVTPDTVEHMRALLALLAAQTQNGLLVEAEETQARMLSMAETILDEDHPDWPAMLHAVARLDLAQGDADEAIAKLHKAREMRSSSNNYTLFWSRVDRLEGQARIHAGLPGGDALLEKAEAYVASLAQ